MKIRWLRGSVRFRISPAEFEQLKRGATVTEILGAPGKGQWAANCLVGDTTEIMIDSGNLTFMIAPADFERFIGEDIEGLYFTSDTSTPFRYYIEKNFPCAHPHAPEARAMDDTLPTFNPTVAFELRKHQRSV